MSLLGGRGGRSDDWATPHLRARARAAERLDGPLDVAEEAWLDDHLAGCRDCARAAADYAGQRLELRALRDRPPLPPRDLWARTAARIEREASRQSRRGRRPPRTLLAPYAMLASAVIVAVVVGSLSLSQFNPPTATDALTASLATGSAGATIAAETPIPVEPGSVAYLTQGLDGKLQLNHLVYSRVCGPTTPGCPTSTPADTQTISPVASPDTVFGAVNRPLVVVSHNTGSGGKVFAIAVANQTATVTPSPSTSIPSPSTPPVASPTASATTSTSTAPPTPSVAPSPPESAPPSETTQPSEGPSLPASPSPSAVAQESASPSAEPGTAVEIARDLKVLDTTAAYAPDGSAFAFTARPSDGSHGPDIYLWHVGDPQAVAITADHRSVFGSWAGTSIVGSTVTASPSGRFDRPMAFLLPAGAIEPKFLGQIGLAWRPVVDPTGRTAVYWAGRVEPTADGLGWTTANGRLVVGRWDDVTASAAASADLPHGFTGASAAGASASASAGASAEPSASPGTAPSPTAVDDAGQPLARSELPISSGPLSDWDARWDATGTRLAVWIADPNGSLTGRLSLYVVDPFDGKIDRSKPALVDEPALAGFAITEGHLAWAAPPTTGSTESSVLVLAWQGDDFGKVESAPGNVLLVR